MQGWTSRLAVEGVRFVALKLAPGAAPAKLALAAVWLRDTRHPTRGAFLRVLQDDIAAMAETA